MEHESSLAADFEASNDGRLTELSSIPDDLVDFVTYVVFSFEDKEDLGALIHLFLNHVTMLVVPDFKRLHDCRHER